MGIHAKHPVGRNDPCPCGSTLKYKKCHGDLLKQAVCDRVANEKMCELVKAEQRKKIIRLQQAECELCGHTGMIPGPLDIVNDIKCTCQFLTDSERIAYEYKLTSERDANDPGQRDS